MHLNSSLKIIGRGSLLTFLGSAFGLGISFAIKIVLARFGGASSFGIYSLSVTLITICSLLSSFGLQDGLPRFIAYSRGKDQAGSEALYIPTAIMCVLAGSILLSCMLFSFSRAMAISVFHKPDLQIPLKILSMAIPFLTLTNIAVSIYQGFDRVQEKIIFQNVIQNVLFLALSLYCVLLNRPYLWIYYAYLCSAILSFILLLIYTYLKNPPYLTGFYANLLNKEGKELLLFSFPLVFIFLFQLMMNWTDTLLLGLLSSSRSIGLYNVGNSLSQFLSLPISSTFLIIVPILSGLLAEGQVIEIKVIYEMITRWISYLTLPVFLFLFFYPQQVLNYLFGANYVGASNMVRILSSCFMIVNIFGPNGTTLIALGKTSFLFIANMIALFINIVLNVLLIPPLGIVGAAIATGAAITIHCIIRHHKVSAIIGTGFIQKGVLRVMVVSSITLFAYSIFMKIIISTKALALAFILASFYIIHILIIILIRPFTDEDYNLFGVILARLRIESGIIRNYIANHGSNFR